MKPYTSTYKIYYEDTDISGVVYHANYLKFFERGRTDFLSSKGFQLKSLIEEGIQFVAADLSIEYKKPAQLNDDVIVLTDLEDIKGARLVFKQTMLRNQNDLLCEAKIVVGCLDLKFKVVRLPARLKQELKP